MIGSRKFVSVAEPTVILDEDTPCCSLCGSFVEEQVRNKVYYKLWYLLFDDLIWSHPAWACYRTFGSMLTLFVGINLVLSLNHQGCSTFCAISMAYPQIWCETGADCWQVMSLHELVCHDFDAPGDSVVSWWLCKHGIAEGRSDQSCLRGETTTVTRPQ